MDHRSGAFKPDQRRKDDRWQSGRLLARRLFKRVLRRLVRIIIVNGPVVRVMMPGSLGVLDLMRKIPMACRARPPAVGSQRVQWQQKQQDDANQSAHESVLLIKPASIIGSVPRQRVGREQTCRW